MAGLWRKNNVAMKTIESNTAELRVVDLGMVTLPKARHSAWAYQQTPSYRYHPRRYVH